MKRPRPRFPRRSAAARRRPAPARRRPAEAPRRPTRLRIAVVEYLNTAPLVWGLERGPAQRRYHLQPAVPSACAEQLRRGHADVGILPAIEVQRISGLRLIPHVAIASQGKVESVLLVSRGPARRAKRVALDASSRTSAALVQILFPRHWGREPTYVEIAPDPVRMLEQADAALLIGDPALRLALRGPAALGLDHAVNWHIYDLGEEWWSLTRLPFVFAVWAVRAEVGQDTRERQMLLRDFQESREQGLAHLNEIAHAAAARLSLPGGQLERYLRYSIDYRLDAPHLAGLESFYRYAREQGLIERAKPVEFL